MYQQEAVYYAVEFLARHILKQQFPSHAAFCTIFHFLRRLQHHHARLRYGLSKRCSKPIYIYIYFTLRNKVFKPPSEKVTISIQVNCLLASLPVGFLLLRYSVLFTVESSSLLYLLVIS